jgi:hypothetical protein
MMHINDLRKDLPAGFFSAFFFSFLGLPPSTGPFLFSPLSAAAAAATSGFLSPFLASFLASFLSSFLATAPLASAPFLSPFF